MPPTPQQLLKEAVDGVPERPLIVPLTSAVAGELEDIEPKAFVYDVTKLSNLVREITLSLGSDAAVAEFGTFWDAEALGMSLDWSAGFPPTPQGQVAVDGQPDFENAGRGPIVLEALGRLRKMVGDQVVLSASVTGPATLSSLSEGALSPDKAASALLPAVRSLCEAGAKLVWVVESAEAPDEPGVVSSALEPLWGTINFYGGLGALHLSGPADDWQDMIEQGGPFVACFDPDQSPGLASFFAEGERSFGLVLPPTEDPSARALELARSGRCSVLTHTGELAGRVSAGDLPEAVRTLEDAAGGKE